MIFQVLDNKKECYAVYHGETLYHYPPKDLKLTHTWNFTPHFSDNKIEYAQFWCEGKSLSNVCPEHLKAKWADLTKKARAFSTSFRNAKINLNDVCFYDLVPRNFLVDYCKMKTEITNWVFEHHKKPANSDFLIELAGLLHDIKGQQLNMRAENLDFIDEKVRKSFGKVKNANNYIEYNLWGTATGRLTTTANSFPILTLNRELRRILVPNNDLYMELDFNSAELRTLFALLGEKQPKEDIHSWINENIFGGSSDRDKTKKRVFSWLYNPKAKNKKLNEYLRRDDLLNKYYHDGLIHTPFKRKIEVGEEKALNYLVQSTASDIFLRAVLKIHDLLKTRKTNIAFCIHDSVVIDLAKEDKPLLQEILDVFSKTCYGDFKVNLSLGKDFGTMRKVL